MYYSVLSLAAENKQPDDVSDDLNYEIWAEITKTKLTEKGLWDVVENGVPPDPSKLPELAAKIQPEELSKWRDLAMKDMRALQILQSSLTESAFEKTRSASSAKEVWDLLEKGNTEQAKLRSLVKQFEEIRMDEGEPFDAYVDRFMGIAEQLRLPKNPMSDHLVNMKLLGTLSRSYDGVFEKQRHDLKNMTIQGLVEHFQACDSVPRRSVCTRCGELGHNASICKRNECIQCGGKGHFFKGCNNRKKRLPQYEMLSLITVPPLTFDEDVWMLYNTTTNHMTPYVKFFTTLDRSHRARVVFADGTITMAEGRGDVKVMTEEGKKKTIKNVLFVPSINRNVLSLGQLADIGYNIMNVEDGICTVKNGDTGEVYAETMIEKRGFALRYHVIKGNLTA